ncbi:MAG TPA: hypothetical protein VGG16_17400, partial [Streptosporangiaceae bacterium]
LGAAGPFHGLDADLGAAGPFHGLDADLGAAGPFHGLGAGGEMAVNFIKNIYPLVDIVQRQVNIMTAIRRSFEGTQRPYAPPTTHVTSRGDITWNTLPADPPTAAELVAEVRHAEPAVAAYLGQDLAAEEVEEVKRQVDTIQADPELSGKIRRLVERIDWSEVQGMTPWAALVVGAVILNRYANTTSPVVTNKLTTLVLIAAIAAIIVSVQLSGK